MRRVSSVLLVCALLASAAMAADIVPLQLDRKGVKNSDQVVYGVDLESGAVAWERRFPREANFARVVEEGILVGCDDGALYLLKADNGDIKWTLQLGGKDEKVNVFHGTLDGRWLVSYHNNVYWLVSRDGKLVWTLR
ncbi:MAG: PQQ-like beta-propeller repeat protein [Acidobacteriota bacterium]